VLSPGATIDDRYEIIDALGSGGMGAVYRARRIHLGDEVAIKVMHSKPDAPPESAADVFTLGVLAYRMATDTVPFKAASLPELIGQMLQTKPTPPAGEMPDGARGAILKAIDGMPANRFASAETFARALA
jgi:serine/threonine protein kinase